MPHLQELAEGIWTASAPHRWIGLHLGTRMTVIRLSSGGLLLHSPVPMSKQLRTELAALGPVGHMVSPNLYHHVYAGDAAAAFPKAVLDGSTWLRRNRSKR